jgi:hypothetical protein
LLFAVLSSIAQAAGFVEVAVRAAGTQNVRGTATITNLNSGEATEGTLTDSRFQAELPAGRYQVTVRATEPRGERETPPFDLADGEARAFYLRLNAQ